MTQTITFRAAYLPTENGGTLLTLPEHAHLDDESLLSAAREEMIRGRVEGTPEIGTWTGGSGNPVDGAPGGWRGAADLRGLGCRGYKRNPGSIGCQFCSRLKTEHKGVPK